MGRQWHSRLLVAYLRSSYITRVAKLLVSAHVSWRPISYNFRCRCVNFWIHEFIRGSRSRWSVILSRFQNSLWLVCICLAKCYKLVNGSFILKQNLPAMFTNSKSEICPKNTWRRYTVCNGKDVGRISQFYWLRCKGFILLFAWRTYENIRFVELNMLQLCYLRLSILQILFRSLFVYLKIFALQFDGLELLICFRRRCNWDAF